MKRAYKITCELGNSGFICVCAVSVRAASLRRELKMVRRCLLFGDNEVSCSSLSGIQPRIVVRSSRRRTDAEMEVPRVRKRVFPEDSKSLFCAHYIIYVPGSKYDSEGPLLLTYSKRFRAKCKPNMCRVTFVVNNRVDA